jgi:hypothetical protein
MTILLSGELGLQNAGTNTSSSTLLSSSITRHGTTATAKFITFSAQYIGGSFTVRYYSGNLFNGIAYGYRSSNTAVLDTNPQTVSNSSSAPTGYTTAVGSDLQDADVLNDEYSIFSTVYNTSDIGWDFASTSMGGLGSYTYTDNSDTSRTIRDLWWHAGNNGTSYSNGKGLLVFSLSGTSVPNTNDTFKTLQVGSLTVNRSDASYASSENGNTVWWWDITASNITSIGNATTFIVSGETITFNNGIAEEMGGADSLDVKLSDYYKNGDIIGNVNGLPTEGSPPAEIKFSDFHGKTFVPKTMIIEIDPGLWYTGKGDRTNMGFQVSNFSYGSLVTSMPVTYNGATFTVTMAKYFEFSGWIFQATISSGTWDTTGWNKFRIIDTADDLDDINLERSTVSSQYIAGSTLYIEWPVEGNDIADYADNNIQWEIS